MSDNTFDYQQKNEEENLNKELKKIKETVNKLETEKQKLAASVSTYKSILIFSSALLFNYLYIP